MRKPSSIFENSMSDLFHTAVSLRFVKQVFAVMEQCPEHRFQILSERSGRLLQLSPTLAWFAKIWMGVMVGGKSGPGARPMNPPWVREIRDQCIAAGVPFFFKQWGGVWKKTTGRILDGQLWDEMPEGR